MEELYREHAKTVYYLLLSKCRDEKLAEDLTQETFLQAMKSIDRYNGECKISVWLCQIAKHLLYQHWEKEKRETHLDDEDWMLKDSSQFEEQIIARYELFEVLKELHNLPEQMREVMYLRISGDLSFAEIGKIVGKTENWARVNFHRGKELLRKRLEDSI